VSIQPETTTERPILLAAGLGRNLPSDQSEEDTLQIYWLKWVGLSGFLLVMSGGVGLATDTSWQQAIETANKLYEQGRYPEAEKAYQEALAAAQEFGPEDHRLVP